MTMHLIDRIPLPALFVLLIALVMLGVTTGHRLGQARRKRSDGAPEGPVGSVVGALLGLVAFMLAFTFSLAAERVGARKALLLEEVNAIGTAVLRAELVPDPQRTECLKLFKAYVDLRVDATRDVEKLAQALHQCEQLQDELWSQARSLARERMDSDIVALFVESLNDVIDLHTSRVVVALEYRVPPAIWLVLLALTMLGMAGIGYQFGLAGRNSVTMHLLMAIGFALVMGLIADLDRTTTSMTRVSQQPMIELQARLARPPAP